MFGFPPLPPFEGLHPIAVHFPIGILMIVWIPIVLGLLCKKHRAGWLNAALLLLALGTLTLFGAVLTGEATEDVVDQSSQLIENAIHDHEELGELVRTLFIAITIRYAAVLLAYNKVADSKKKPVALIGGLIFLLSYTFGTMTLANVGHQGGILVHDLGIHAPIGTFDPTTLNPKSDSHEDHSHDD